MNVELSPEFDWFTFLQTCIYGAVTFPEEEADGTPGDQWTQEAMQYFALVQAAAKQWPTCACGQLCKQLPRCGNGEPIDRELYQLGLMFLTCINCQQWREAYSTLKAIEERSTRLLNGLDKMIPIHGETD